MASGEQFSLCYKDFDSNIRYSWTEFQLEKDFCDVTLACDDKQIETHKFIISSFSPVFRNILKQNSHNHPLIYLKGVKYDDLENMIHFMYQGEVNIAQEALNSFLAVAEDLKIKGLSGENENKAEINNEQDHLNQTPKRKRSNENIIQDVAKTDLDLEEFTNSKNEAMEKLQIQGFVEPEYTNSKDEAMERLEIKDVEEQSVRILDLSKIADGINYCEQCDKQFTTNTGLYYHNSTVHKGIRYSCDQCAYKATRKHQLKVHINSIHEGVRLPCSQCAYKATQKSNLTNHIKKVHN